MKFMVQHEITETHTVTFFNCKRVILRVGGAMNCLGCAFREHAWPISSGLSATACVRAGGIPSMMNC